MAVIFENVDKIITSDGTEHDLDNMSFGVGALSEMTNTSITSPQDGDNLVWDGVAGAWVPSSEITIPTGEAVFTTAGTFTWTPPIGVENVCVVCVGGGGGGGGHDARGGSGGGLAWKNNISVSPGAQFNVKVGAGGNSGGGTYAGGYSGEHSYLEVQGATGPICLGGGGEGGTPNNTNAITSASQIIGDGGGAGGLQNQHSYARSGGGGAGGYSGNGGDGGNANYGNNPTSGAGGGGAGAWGHNNYLQGGGGGVGIFGEGASGIVLTVSAALTSHAGVSAMANGEGGSGGDDGFYVSGQASGGLGGLYGGGGGGGYSANSGGKGGQGAVRIIWGEGRSFPNNAA